MKTNLTFQQRFWDYAKRILRWLFLLLLGPFFLSLMVTGTAVSSQFLQKEFGAEIPSSQSTIVYFLLLVIYMPIYLSIRIKYWKKESWKDLLLGRSMNIPWFWYVVVAVLDVEGNFLLVMAYQYTTMTSVMLLDCFTIPNVMILSVFFLGARYRWMHLLGSAMCIAGIGLVFLSDSMKDVNVKKVLLGDLLCLLGTLFYAISNVFVEYSIKKKRVIVEMINDHDLLSEVDDLDADENPMYQQCKINENSPETELTTDQEPSAQKHSKSKFRHHMTNVFEYLAFLGLFGFFVSCIQSIVLEHQKLDQIHFNGKIIGSLVGFVLSMVSLYSLIPLLLFMSSATFLNLSLLTSDFYGVIANYLFFREWPHYFYAVAFIVVVCGLLIYNLKPESRRSTSVLEWIGKKLGKHVFNRTPKT